MEDIRHRSECFVEIACESSEPIPKADLVEIARERLTKPNGDAYSEQYMSRVVSTYAHVGVLNQTADGITVYEFGHEWRQGEIDFQTLLWYGVKQSWALEGSYPEGIEGLYNIHRVVKRVEEPISREEIRVRLADRYGYEFNDGGIRGYLPLLEQMGALDKRESGFLAGNPNKFSDRFRQADILWQYEQWLKREGATSFPPSDRVKRDLAKYYMYRESGGVGQHRRLLDTARKEYLDESVTEDSSEPKLRRSELYVEQERRRKRLRDDICSRFERFEPRDLAGLSTAVLERIANADSPEEASRVKSGAGSGFSRTDLERLAATDRPVYTFPEEFELYDWQREAVNEWFADTETRPEHGIAQVVTGAGKTVMALAVIRQWLENNSEGVVTVVVPTKVLMHQWLEELVDTLGVPPSDVGWLGDGHKDSFGDGPRILISIVNSAVKNDALSARLSDIDTTEHLLIADECHRYTGDHFSKIFDCERTAALGLSATPLSDPTGEELSPEDEMLLSNLGEIYYELSYDEGLERGLIPRFRINYVGFELTDAEQMAYDRLTDAVVDAITDIERQYQNRLYELDGSFARKLQVIKNEAESPTPAITDYFEYTTERRELVADAVARQAVTLDLLNRNLESDQKTIVFQERIEQLERMVAPKETRGRNYGAGEGTDTDVDRAKLYNRYPELERIDDRLEDLFFKSSYRPVMYHSGHRSDAWNDFAIEWFGDDGFANVMLSVKALIEGVDVPSADVGIVRVSSGSVRQRIQTLGRILRTGENPDKQAELYVLYARDTVDENIFDRYDWRKELSRAEVRHLTWDTDEDTIDGILRSATDDEIPEPPTVRTVPDTDEIERGDPYEGPREGFQFSVDSEGRAFSKTSNGRKIIEAEDYQEVASFVYREKGGGSVTVNEADHAITFLNDEWVYLGEVSDPSELTYHADETGSLTDESEFSLEDL
ncbi:DEAD/DEAH box helicase [Haloarchaeobius salinus]|uniref:DEAD/DEAH box helicase n=1 Tax=Haloarchaeobius salinus TaxID=1198298 RepID=UPI00210C453A|nr:DEAD/DEAH box helicase family protein [Haloarchaeobius salinus]